MMGSDMISKGCVEYINTLINKLKSNEKLTDGECIDAAMYLESYLSFLNRYKECKIRTSDEKKFKYCHYYSEYIIEGIHAPLCYNDYISEEQSMCPCENCDWYITNEEADKVVHRGEEGNL